MKQSIVIITIVMTCALLTISHSASTEEVLHVTTGGRDSATESPEDSGTHEALQIGDISVPSDNGAIWRDYSETAAPTQSQIDEIAAAYQAIPLNENPTDEEVISFIQAVMKVAAKEAALLGRFPHVIGADKALARIPTSHLPTLFRASKIVNGFHFSRAIKSMDVSEHKDLILSELRTMPNLLGIAAHNGWGSEAMDLAMEWFAVKEPMWHARTLLDAMVENWSLDMREPFVRMLVTEISQGELLDYLRRLVHLDRESRQVIVSEVWLRHDLSNESQGKHLRLAQLAMNEGEIGALLSVLAFLRGRAVSEEARMFAAPDHLLPLQLHSNACSLLGVELPAEKLYDWVYERRELLQFDIVKRRFVLHSPVIQSGI